MLKKKPPVDTSTEEEERLMNERWGPKEDSLIQVMKDAILSGPVLKRPNWTRPFCVKTDWSSLAKGAVLCQPKCTPEAEAVTYDEYDLQIVTIDVYPRLCKCDYKLITLRDSPCAPLHSPFP